MSHESLAEQFEKQAAAVMAEEERKLELREEVQDQLRPLIKRIEVLEHAIADMAD